MSGDDPFGAADPSIYEVRTHAPGPEGSLPLTPERLRDAPSGDLFGWTQDVGMGWRPEELGRDEFLILSTQGGLRAADGAPVALGFHTGHWELGLLVEAAARELRALGAVPFAGAVSDPCDGRTQGTTGMMDSLPWRNDAAIVFRRLARSLPTRRGVLGIATCDKGLPAMMMAVAGMPALPAVIVPGGVTLPPTAGEDAGKVQTIGVRFARGLLELDEAAALGCRACATPGGGCQFLGTAATSQVVCEALGLAVPHSALAPSGSAVWLEGARRSARALAGLRARGVATRDVVTAASLRNAMVVHAAFGGSTNLLLHVPAIAHAAGLPRPGAADWLDVNRRTPRLVDALPNGPIGHPTVRLFLAGGVPEVLLHLRALGLLQLGALAATGQPLGEVLDAWQGSERRTRFREALRVRDGVDPDDVISPPERAAARGMTATAAFPRGNLAPEGALVKATAIDPSVVGADGVYRHRGPARVFTRERDAVQAIKAGGVRAGDVVVLCGRGPLGAGMEEVAQVTSALRHLEFGKHVAVVTDARFSGLSAGACVGHVAPEALAGGPIGKVLEGDVIEVVIDRRSLEGRVDLVGHGARVFGAEKGARLLDSRPTRPDVRPDEALPEDTRLWAALVAAGGGAWGGCVYDASAIIRRLGGG